MKRSKIAIILFLGVIFIMACQDEPESNFEIENTKDYLVFGHFYGFCIGESCIEIYKIEDNKLFEDINDNYPSSTEPYQANYVKISDSKFQLANDIYHKFPQKLLEEEDIRIGQPDAGDWGGIYFETYYKGKKRFWLIDQKKENVPSYLHEFIDIINRKIELIND